MLVCNVSYVPPRTIAAEIAEAVTASAATTTQGLVFSALVDDPTSALDTIDALLGEIMLEAASATDTVGAAGSVYAGAVDEAAIAADVVVLAAGVYSVALVEAATAADVPDATVTSVAAMTTMGVAGPLFVFDPTFSGSSLTVIDGGR